MIALLAILTAGVVLGRCARRITPPLEILLFVVVAAIVLGQLAAWKAGIDLGLKALVERAVGGML